MSNLTNKKDPNFERQRLEIDELDKELVELIGKRLKVTKAIGEIKSELGLPLYHPKREAELIDNNRAYAEKFGVSAQLIEDVIRRIIRDSYKSQNARRQFLEKKAQKNITIVGGDGQFGHLFFKLFDTNGDKVSVIEKHDKLIGNPKLASAELVLISVPIHVTADVIKQLGNALKDVNPNCILADVTSIKAKPLAEMLKQHQGPIVGLHPMFGPGIDSFAKQTVALCHGRFSEKYQWFLDLLKNKGMKLIDIKAQEHDHLMSIIQVLRHFSTVAYGNHLRYENISLEKTLELSSPIYRLELAMVGRLFAQDPVLYSDIIFSDKNNIKMIQRFIKSLQDTLELVNNDDKEKFIKTFNETKTWFGNYADQFSIESNHLLAKASDR